MTTLTSSAAAILCTEALTALIDEGTDTSPAQIIIWGGPVPLDADAAVSSTCEVLATFDLPSPAFGPVALNGDNVEALMHSAVAPTVLGSATGTVTFCRFYNGLGDAVLQADVGLADSGALVSLNSLSIHAGEDVSILGAPILQMPIR